MVVPGIILGILALSNYKKSKNAYDTNPGVYKPGSLGCLKAGKITGIIGLIASPLFILFWVFYFSFLMKYDPSFRY